MASVFDSMTNLYSLSKTLRFELKPVGKTKELLEENHIIELDKLRKEKYEKVKPYLNKLHLDFVNKSLEGASFEYREFEKTYSKWNKDKKNKTLTKQKESNAKKLREEIEKLFDKSAKEYLYKYPEIQFKKHDKEFLYEVGVFDILKEKYGKEPETHIIDPESKQQKTIFDDWTGWLGYFTKFFNTRRNFYKSDGTSTALATRIINDNLVIFLENRLVYEKLKDSIHFSDIEKDFGKSPEKVFDLNFYNTCFLQKGIDEYNKIIGGETLENGKKLKGLNEYVNQYRQDSGNKVPFFKKLQKQILSERKQSFIQKIEDSNEFEEVLRDFYESSVSRVVYLEKKLEEIGRYEDDQYRSIYITNTAFKELAYTTVNDVQIFEKIVYESMKSDKVQGIKYAKKENSYSFPDFIPLYYVKYALENYQAEELFWKDRYYVSEDTKSGFLERKATNLWYEFSQILQYEFMQLLSKEIVSGSGEILIIGYSSSKERLKEVLERGFKLSEDNKSLIKDFADYTRALYSRGKYFALEKSREWDHTYDLDDDFYKGENGYLERFYDNAYEEIIVPYNLMRDYISQKPWSDVSKWKLNFDKSNLLGGFTESKTEKSDNGTQYGGYLFRKKEDDGVYGYYLGVSKNAKLFRKDTDHLPGEQMSEYERLNYYQVMTRSIYGASYEGDYKEDKCRLSEDEVILKVKNSLRNYINAIPDFIDVIKDPSLSLKSIQEEISQIVQEKGTIFDYKIISQNDFGEAERSKEGFYLFKIHSKDLYLTEGQKNLHTLYFTEIMSGERSTLNLGVGEIFFRPKIHRNQLGTRIDNTGKEILKHKRFSEDKILLHLSIVQNNGSPSVPQKEAGKIGFRINFNQKINTLLANNPDINIIGVDRGEKHLAYYTVLNQQGEIVQDDNGRSVAGTLNHISAFDADGYEIMRPEKKLVEIKNDEGSTVEYRLEDTGKQVPYTDYALLLEVKEKNRRLQRQSWKAVEQIKDLKKGYISAVVKKLSDLIIKYNAIIVFEDLNMRFKQIRGGIEKSVYQQLEKALIDKLNFLVDKNEMDATKAGHILKAYQLTAPVEAFKDMGKQTGVIFYTSAAYTSKIDPVTGWRPHLYLKKQTAEKNKETILKFEEILFNAEKKRFEFTYDRRNFSQADKAQFPDKTVWTICSCVERYRWSRTLNNNKGGYEHYKDLSNEFRNLFENYGIDCLKNILEQIEGLPTQGNERFFSDFIYYFTLVNQIRNTNPNKQGNDNDFILSPVEPFFDSRKSEMFGKHLPQNGDENGAYNIARKGLILLDRLNTWHKEEKEKNPDLFVSNIDRDNHIEKV